MPRMISFALTTPQFKARTKTVTRRLGWEKVKPGELLQGVEKCQGIPKGGKVVKLELIRVVSVSREPLRWIADSWGQEECAREGFPDMTPWEFVEFFCKANRPCEPTWPVTRIEFEYLTEGA